MRSLLGRIHELLEERVFPVLQQAERGEQELAFERLREGFSDLFMLRAQAHTDAFLFPKFLGSPFLKRDLVYREQVILYEVERAC
jgi:hypothetical protein